MFFRVGWEGVGRKFMLLLVLLLLQCSPRSFLLFVGPPLASTIDLRLHFARLLWHSDLLDGPVGQGLCSFLLDDAACRLCVLREIEGKLALLSSGKSA